MILNFVAIAYNLAMILAAVYIRWCFKKDSIEVDSASDQFQKISFMCLLGAQIGHFIISLLTMFGILEYNEDKIVPLQ